MQTVLTGILDFLAETTGRSVVDLDAASSFAALGLASAQAVTMMARLSTHLDRRLSPILPWEYPSPQALARHLAGEVDDALATAARSARVGEPIAVIGMACRLPGASTLEAFWSLLSAGIDTVGEIPTTRWPAAAFHEPDTTVPDRMSTRRGAFIERVDLFDPAAFGISPREAAEIDPQQRLGLELTVEAAEDAGVPLADLAGREIGMFWGAMSRDFAEIQQDLLVESPYRGTGMANNMIANRISYVLDTTGPSLVVDTACSSSLVALDLAAQSLARGQCTMAFVGAVNIVLSPLNMVAVSKSLGLAADGRCKAFSAEADGPGRGEGAGVVLLKPLSHAMRDGDRIYATVRATAVNNDGRSNGLTAPNGLAQERVLRRAYADAGVAPEAVDYVEAHGTGTPLGDPIEVAALGRVLGALRPEGTPLRVGSVKSNVAHLEAAAGMAGLIKTVLMLHRRTLLPSLHAQQLNPVIDFSGAGIAVVREAEPWPAKPARPIYAGVSSFGWGGTNAHAVLEGLPVTARFIGLAADSEPELMRRLQALSEGNEALPEYADADTESGPWRAGLALRDRGDLRRLLAARAAGRHRPGLQIGRSESDAGSVVMVCGPAGGQWAGMARQLFAREAAFRAALLEAGAAIAAAGGGDVVDDLLGAADAERFETVAFMVPAVFAMQVAQCALVRSWGAAVDGVVGYSIGEIAAACVSGQLDLASAAAVAVAYGAAAARIEGQGGLLLVMAGRQAVQGIVPIDGHTLFVAGELSDGSMMLAGTPEALAGATDSLRAAKVLISPIRVPLAAHSPLAGLAADELALGLPVLRPGIEAIPFHSVVTGREHPPRSLDAAYFGDNLRAENRLPPVIRQLLAAGHRRFVELGPQTILADGIQRIAAADGISGVLAVGLGRIARDESETITEARAALFAAGSPSATPSAEHLIVLSARHEVGLRELAAAHAVRLAETRVPALPVLAAALARRRTPLPWRLSLVESNGARAAELLARFAADGQAARVEVGQARSHQLVFVFSGQGSQWAAMGAGLLSQSAPARRMVERLAPVAAAEAGIDIASLLCDASHEETLARTDVAQPALVALQLALCAHLESVHLRPSSVIGHSIGEVTAACVAGALSPETAMALACRRGRAMQSAAGDGRMASFACPADALRQMIRQLELPLDVAAENDRDSCVVGGPAEALDVLSAHAVAQGLRVQPLRVAFAFHTRAMDGPARRLQNELSDLAMDAPRLPLYSTVTGGRLNDALQADHWARGIREPVRFADAVSAALRDKATAFLSIAPQSALLENIAAIARTQGREVLNLASLRRRVDARPALLELLGQCHTHGLTSDLRAVYPESDPCPLPSTPWNRRRHWPDMSRRRQGAAAVFAGPESTACAESAPEAAPPAAPDLGGRLRDLAMADRVEWLRERLIGDLAALLGADADSLSPDTPFMAMGLDSHMGLSLRSQLQTLLDIPLPPTLIWSYVDVASLAAYLAQELEGPTAPASEPGRHPDSEPRAGEATVDSRILKSHLADPPHETPVDALSQLLNELEAS
jgi:acyl transferase domain-containing protein